MKRPERKDYDFNDLFDALLFSIDMMKYSDYLEKQSAELRQVNKNSIFQDIGISAYHSCNTCDHFKFDSENNEHGCSKGRNYKSNLYRTISTCPDFSLH